MICSQDAHASRDDSNVNSIDKKEVLQPLLTVNILFELALVFFSMQLALNLLRISILSQVKMYRKKWHKFFPHKTNHDSCQSDNWYVIMCRMVHYCFVSIASHAFVAFFYYYCLDWFRIAFPSIVLYFFAFVTSASMHYRLCCHYFLGGWFEPYSLHLFHDHLLAGRACISRRLQCQFYRQKRSTATSTDGKYFVWVENGRNSFLLLSLFTFHAIMTFRALLAWNI